MTVQNLSFTIRPIEVRDNAIIAAIIRDTLTEFEANKPGTAYYDASTDTLFSLFQTQGSVYYIAEADGTVLGGAGIYPTDGLPEDTCELVKMYLIPAARGYGIGRKLIEHCLEQAVRTGYRQVYLESMPALSKALRVYEKMGFSYLNAPLGNSGHFACGIWMLKQL